MFCNQCGLDVPDNYKYCPKCGTEVNEITDINKGISETKINQEEKIREAKRKINRQTIVAAISVPIVLIVIAAIVGTALSGPNIPNQSSLTETQKAVIDSMTQDCQNNMAYLQSQSAGELVEKRCMDKVNQQIAQFKKTNQGNKT